MAQSSVKGQPQKFDKEFRKVLVDLEISVRHVAEHCGASHAYVSNVLRSGKTTFRAGKKIVDHMVDFIENEKDREKTRIRLYVLLAKETGDVCFPVGGNITEEKMSVMYTSSLNSE